jgi:hypothetical protein
MRHPIKLIIKKRDLRKDDTHLIYIQYCYAPAKKMALGTGIGIPEMYWNNKTSTISINLPDKFGDHKMLGAELREQLRKAEKLIDFALTKGNTCPAQFLKKHFRKPNDKYLDQVGYDFNKLNLFYQIDDYIRNKTGSVNDSTLRAIRNMKKHLLSYQEYDKVSITFDCLDTRFYEGFIKYLTFEIPLIRCNLLVRGLKINTIGKTVKQLKTFLRDRMSRKIIPFSDLSFLKGMEEEVDNVYLSWDELSIIYQLDLSGVPFLVKYRDLFVLACLTGFRFSDFSSIQFEDFRDGMLHVVQKKTKSLVIVPLREDARRILVEKYDLKIPNVSMQNFNYYVKEVIRLAGITQPIKICYMRGCQIMEEIKPKYAWVSSHTARRSFCTNEYLAGTPNDLIMAISGHKTEKTFRIYIKADQIKKATMILKLWQGQPNL